MPVTRIETRKIHAEFFRFELSISKWRGQKAAVMWNTQKLWTKTNFPFTLENPPPQKKKCYIAGGDCLLYLLPPSRATNFHVAKSKRRFYFLQHENLLRAEVVIRAPNNLNLQHNIVARHFARKCCSYYWAFSPWPYRSSISILERSL